MVDLAQSQSLSLLNYMSFSHRVCTSEKPARGDETSKLANNQEKSHTASEKPARGEETSKLNNQNQEKSHTASEKPARGDETSKLTNNQEKPCNVAQM